MTDQELSNLVITNLITQEEAEALEAISKAGYEIEFALIKEASIGTWDKFRGQFGFN